MRKPEATIVTGGPALPVHYVRQIADVLRTMGRDVDAWLASSGLGARDLAEGAPGLTLAAFDLLVRDALVVTAEPALGLLVGERLLATTHGILGYAVMNSATLRQAIDLLAHYLPLRISLVSLQKEEVGRDLRVGFVETAALGAIARPVLETVVLATKNVLDAITLGTCRIGAVAFSFPRPAYAPLAQDLFRCAVSWKQPWTGLSLPVDALDLPLQLGDPAAFAEAARICERDLERLVGSASFSTRVRRILLEKQSGFPSLAVVARLLHLTPRTLHRRLVAEGSSFKEILDDVRHVLAVEHVLAGTLGIEATAYTLGYSDIANFRRAFRRWEGVPPSAYRLSRDPRRSRDRSGRPRGGA